MKMRTYGQACGAFGVLLMFAMSAAYADPRGGQRGERGERGDGPHERFEHFDARYDHNRYYPSRGYEVGVLPRDRILVNRFHDRFFYSGGVWYAPRGPRFVVVAPPVGVFVPLLPSFYTTIWIGGIPYYYANDAYYVWRDGPHAYEVVEPPDDGSATTQAPASDEVFVYPKNGQSPEQQARDKYECHK
jgi:hypothetical protein